MGNLCNKELPHITLSCVNTGTVSSCCKASDLEVQPIILYKWTYTNTNDENMINWNGSNSWYTGFDQYLKEALCRMEVSPQSIVQLFIYEWNAMERQPPQIVFHRQISAGSRPIKQ